MIDFNHNNSALSQYQLDAGGIDWLSHWHQMYDAAEAQSSQAGSAHPDPATDRWAGQARRYVTATGRAGQPDAFMQFLLPLLRPDDQLLDIGAGAGRHALFLATQIAHVYAVERSATMRQHLLERIAQQQAERVMVIPGAWPEVSLPAPIDIAITAHVIYGIRDIAPFLLQMHQSARRGWFILVGFRQPAYAFHPFWERIHGSPRLALPGALECLNLLYQLGIPAQMNLLPASRYTFADEAEALADIRWRLHLPATPTADAMIQEAMAALLERDEKGRLALPEQSPHTALLWFVRDKR